MRKFLILNLVLLIVFSSLFLFPRVSNAGWNAPVGPFASDPSKPDIKDTISMSGVFSSTNSEMSSRREVVGCFYNSEDGSSEQRPCSNPPETCFASGYYNRPYQEPGSPCYQLNNTNNITYDYNNIVYKTIYTEKITLITTNQTIQIKWKNSKSVERIDTISEKKEIYYYDCSNVDCKDIPDVDTSYIDRNIKTLTNYFYEPKPARSDVVVLPLNNWIRHIGGPECVYQGGRYQTIVDCATFGLSADGRIGDARYHNSISASGSWWEGFVDRMTFGLSDFFQFTDSISDPGNPPSVSYPTIYGTVENSNSLGVGNWTWTGFWNNTNTGFIIPPPPTVNLQTADTVSISKPDDKTLIGLGWNSTNADSCIASGDWSGNKSTNGTESVSKSRGNYTFNLSCSGPGGSVSDSVVVNVIQVPKCSFSADPASIILPQTSTLSWSCDYANSCSINQNIGSVSNVSGSKVIRPDKTTNYTLSCNGLDGSNSFNVNVNIGFIPRIKEVNPGAGY